MMKKLNVYSKGHLHQAVLSISEDRAATVAMENGEQLFQFSVHGLTDDLFFDKFNNLIIVPGFSDIHVHLREPGFSYKETIGSGTLAAASAGYTAVCSMPNLNPPPDNLDNLRLQIDKIEKDAVIDVHPFGTITKGEMGKELSDMEEIADFIIGFTDDGRGVQDDELMLEAMKLAKKLNKVIAAHCEVDELVKGGVIHDGEYAKSLGLPGISSESEYLAIERDLALVRETGCAYHVCHMSAKESVELIRQGKKEGLPISCETAPHYLLLSDEDLENEGRFKMNPPIRTREDREALIEGIRDGTIDAIATDHAPHSFEEKSKGLLGSMMGITGLETAFPVLYTNLVLKNIISLERLIELMSVNPDKLLSIKKNNDWAIINLDSKYRIDSNNFYSKGRATPFEGWEVFGRNIMTIKDGRMIWHMIEN